MKATDTFRLVRQHHGDDPYTEPQSQLLRAGAATSVTILGATLEAQFVVDDDLFLLVVTDDSPFEETLRVYLVTGATHVVEHAYVGYAYAGGIVRDVQVVDARTLSFAFTAESRFRVTVHSAPGHFWNEPRGLGDAVRALSRRRLEITREPLHAD